MKIESGKYYRTRDGRKVGPMEEFGYSGRFREEYGDRRWWDENGIGGNQAIGEDLISEWFDLTPNQQRTAEMIKVMQAYVDGEEVELMFDGGHIWHKDDNPLWDWRGGRKYRIAPAATPDTIDWSHVSPEFNWMARDEDGTAWLFKSEPRIYNEIERWTCKGVSNSVSPIASYRPGTCDWKDSLVKRPE